ncbi:translationally-controlled tumor protein [Coccomyxa subellipsoidea C-169]|uniref:Translationally-controlled tumor protein n=1 Tax=Coccomyxa subellipsoidea (strain C-169) TaxID=574566 RepID=I0Z4F8_COCSC|nr:translationally-controlled tumor protein [Coccomyxa subellipsoidea C-169]EIE25527.1 translationally-controlled tumor protein [Coccomyxa subellipsoidea C-169]|eukprot:XP_005650071.1 translationally-controlled tumor protein [Coccomyxa subellipsoidea C-169]
MLIYKDLLSGDELISDSYNMKESEDGFFYEVDGKWVTVGDVDVDIGANPSAEEEEDGVDSQSRKVVDVVDAFRLNEQPSYDKKQFLGWAKEWLKKVLEKLPADQQEDFKAKSQPAIKMLMGKIKELQFFLGESMDQEGTLIFAYYADGAAEPKFLYPKYALQEIKA